MGRWAEISGLALWLGLLMVRCLGCCGQGGEGGFFSSLSPIPPIRIRGIGGLFRVSAYAVNTRNRRNRRKLPLLACGFCLGGLNISLASFVGGQNPPLALLIVGDVTLDLDPPCPR